MVTLIVYLKIFYFIIALLSYNRATNIKNYESNINETFLKTISHHYCSTLKGVHVVILAKNSAASFYNILIRSFLSTFYVHNTLDGDFSSSEFNILYIEDERFFFDENNYDNKFWNTIKTYLIISENKLKTKIVLWPHIRRLWDTFRVFRISTLYIDDLRVLRIFDDGFYKYTTALKLNYGLQNVKGYPLRVAVFPRVRSLMYKNGLYTGPDWETLQLFVRFMNFNMNITLFTDNFFFGSFKNGSYNGMLGEVSYGRADVAFNSRFMDDPMINKSYRYTITYGFDYVCFISPAAELLSKMEIMRTILTPKVWFFVLLTFVVMAWSFMFFNKFGLSSARRILNPLMTSFQIILGLTFNIRSNHIVLRLMLVLCSITCFVIVSSIQASLVTMLSTEVHHKEIDTLKEIDKSGMEIRTSLSSVRDMLAMDMYTKPLANKIILENYKYQSDRTKFITIVRIRNTLYHKLLKFPNYIGSIKNKSIKLHVVRECPIKFYLTYAVSLEFPFLEEFNDILLRLQEVGLSNKWIMDVNKIDEKFYPLIKTLKDVKSYSINDLSFAFIFLFGGLAISTIVLIFEII